jgi:ribosomal protein S18 acetylase RimI-like enzyme
VTQYPLLLYVVERGSPRPEGAAPDGVRKLTRADRPALVALASRRGDLVVSEYSHLDPEQEAIWGFFEGGRLRAVARAVVRLPTLWLLGGIYVDPSARGRGLGVAIVGAALDAGVRAGASVALFVRADRAAARAVYERAGFQLRGRRVWLDAGADLEP